MKLYFQVQDLTDPDHVTARYRVAETDAHYIEIVGMGFNWRVHTVRKDGGPLAWSQRYWCYAGRDSLSWTTAMLAIEAWDGADDTEPVGWVKSWDQRYGQPGIGQRGPDGVLVTNRGQP